MDNVNYLRKLFPIGSYVTTHVAHVSRSGMSRVILVLAYDKEQKQIINVSYAVAKVTGYKYNESWRGVEIGGTGMDMAFKLTYDLSGDLYRNSRSKKITDNRAGYALKQNTV